MFLASTPVGNTPDLNGEHNHGFCIIRITETRGNRGQDSISGS